MSTREINATYYPKTGRFYVTGINTVMRPATLKAYAGEAVVNTSSEGKLALQSVYKKSNVTNKLHAERKRRESLVKQPRVRTGRPAKPKIVTESDHSNVGPSRSVAGQSRSLGLSVICHFCGDEVSYRNRLRLDNRNYCSPDCVSLKYAPVVEIEEALERRRYER